jgi:hypothetical protein
MPQGENAEKKGRTGLEYWGHRPGPREPSKQTKRLTHKIERAEKRRIVRKMMKGQAMDDSTASREG